MEWKVSHEIRNYKVLYFALMMVRLHKQPKLTFQAVLNLLSLCTFAIYSTSVSIRTAMLSITAADSILQRTTAIRIGFKFTTGVSIWALWFFIRTNKITLPKFRSLLDARPMLWMKWWVLVIGKCRTHQKQEFCSWYDHINRSNWMAEYFISYRICIMQLITLSLVASALFCYVM